MIKENTAKPTLAPVEKSVEVALSIEAAFKLFTEGIGSWWPLDERFSISGPDGVKSCTLEGRVGGRIFETDKDGGEHMWGTVQAFEPPTFLAASWHPGRASEFATYYEVRFTATENGTRVDLIHTGWEAVGEGAAESRAGYDNGWNTVLGEFVKKSN